MAYRLALPPQLSSVHNVFHVSMLQKYERDTSHVIDWQPLEIREDVTYIEQPIRILDRKDQILRTKTCLLYTSPSPRDLSTSRMPSSA